MGQSALGVSTMYTRVTARSSSSSTLPLQSQSSTINPSSPWWWPKPGGYTNGRFTYRQILRWYILRTPLLSSSSSSSSSSFDSDCQSWGKRSGKFESANSKLWNECHGWSDQTRHNCKPLQRQATMQGRHSTMFYGLYEQIMCLIRQGFKQDLMRYSSVGPGSCDKDSLCDVWFGVRKERISSQNGHFRVCCTDTTVLLHNPNGVCHRGFAMFLMDHQNWSCQ